MARMRLTTDDLDECLNRSFFFIFTMWKIDPWGSKLVLYVGNFKENSLFFLFFSLFFYCLWSVCIITVEKKIKGCLLYPFLNLLSGGIITGLWGRWLMWCLNLIIKHYTLNRACQSMYSIPHFPSPSQDLALALWTPVEHIFTFPQTTRKWQRGDIEIEVTYKSNSTF